MEFATRSTEQREKENSNCTELRLFMNHSTIRPTQCEAESPPRPHQTPFPPNDVQSVENQRTAMGLQYSFSPMQHSMQTDRPRIVLLRVKGTLSLLFKLFLVWFSSFFCLVPSLSLALAFFAILGVLAVTCSMSMHVTRPMRRLSLQDYLYVYICLPCPIDSKFEMTNKHNISLSIKRRSLFCSS